MPAKGQFPKITFTITSCRRLELFRTSMSSFLERCGDSDTISRWICVDDGSLAPDLQEMRAEYPWLEIVCSPEQARGHDRALQLVWSQIDTPLVFHMEDDWRFDQDFLLADLVEELGDLDQLVLQWNPRAVDQPFNPRHVLIEGEREQIARELGYETRPKNNNGWFWPGFSLNPSLFRLDRVRDLVPKVPDGPRFEFDLALRLRRAGFEAVHRPFELVHLGELSAYILNDAERPNDITNLAQTIIAKCSSDPRLVIQLREHLDLELLDTGLRYRVSHAMASAWWYVDRDRGKGLLREMWRRYRSTGFLFSLECARLLDFYGETWESLEGWTPPPADLETALSLPVADRQSLRSTKQKRQYPSGFPAPSRLPDSTPFPEVTLIVTTCRRLDLFIRTINAFLACCSDHERIGRWICIDDNSSADDRHQMKEAFPFFEFVWKGPEDRGHAKSLQMLQDMVTSPYIFHLEDDQEFFVPSHYIGRCLRGLSVGTSIGQCLVNLSYAESLDDYFIQGGLPFQNQGDAFVAHLFDPERNFVRGRSNCHWPHFSLRPGLVHRDVWDLGFRDVPFFEREFAHRYEAAGWRTIFLPDIYHLHAQSNAAVFLRKTEKFLGPRLEVTIYWSLVLVWFLMEIFNGDSSPPGYFWVVPRGSAPTTFWGADIQSNLRNSSLVRPTSRTIPPIVRALTGLCRGMVTIREPSVITMCLPWRAIRNPAFFRALTASR